MLRVFHHYVSARKLMFFLAETLSIGLAGVVGAGTLALLISPPGTSVPLDRMLFQLGLYALGLAALFQVVLYAVDLYDLKVASEDLGGGGGARLIKAAGVAVFALGLGGLALRVRAPTGVLLGGALGAVAGAMAVRLAMRARLGQGSRVFVLGDGLKARALSRMIREGGEGAFEVCGMAGLPREGTEGAVSLDAQAIQQRARYVVVALDEPRGGRWMDALFRCRLAGMQVYDAAGFCERVLRRLPVTHLRAAELAFEERLTVSPGRRMSKRAVDVLAAFALLLLAAPLGLLVVVAIKLDSRGPIFYAQERVGLGGRPYRLWKFRSMRQDAERGGAVWARKNDDRVTRVGRFIRKCRVDELPQLYNVLRGDMSLVGPRPERPVFVDQLKQQIPFYGLRELIKPGVTGWAQIRYPYGASVEDARNKLELDLYYVKNGSLFLDLAITFHTVRHVLMGRGAR